MQKIRRGILCTFIVSVFILGVCGFAAQLKTENASDIETEEESEFLDISKDSDEEYFEEDYEEEIDLEYDDSNEIIVSTYADTSVNVSTYSDFVTAVSQSSSYGTVNVTASFVATGNIRIYGNRTINMNGNTIIMRTNYISCEGTILFNSGTITGTINNSQSLGRIGLLIPNIPKVSLIGMNIRNEGTAATIYRCDGNLSGSDDNNDAIYISDSTICNTGTGPAIYAGGGQIYNARISNSEIYASGQQYSFESTYWGKTITTKAYAVYSTYANIILENGSRAYITSTNNEDVGVIKSRSGDITIDSTSRVETPNEKQRYAIWLGEGSIDIAGYVESLGGGTDKSCFSKINIAGNLNFLNLSAGTPNVCRDYDITISGNGYCRLKPMYSLSGYLNLKIQQNGTLNIIDEYHQSLSSDKYMNIEMTGGTIDGLINLSWDSKAPTTFKMTDGIINGGIVAGGENTIIEITGGKIINNSNDSIYYTKYYLQNSPIHICRGTTLTITDGEFIDTVGNQVIHSHGNGNIDIQGGTFSSTFTNDLSSYYCNLITINGTTTCKISNGTFINDRYAYAGIAVKGSASLEVTNGSFEGKGKAISVESCSSASILGGDYSADGGIWIKDNITSDINIANVNMTGGEGVRIYCGINPTSLVNLNISNSTFDNSRKTISTTWGSHGGNINLDNVESVGDIRLSQNTVLSISNNSSIEGIYGDSTTTLNITLNNSNVGTIMPTKTDIHSVKLSNEIGLENITNCNLSLVNNVVLNAKMNLYGTTTLDTNGYTLDCSYDCIQNYGTSTVMSSNVGGKITSTNSLGTIINHGTLTSTSGTIENTGTEGDESNYALHNEGTLNISGATLTARKNIALAGSVGAIHIDSGHIQGQTRLSGNAELYLSNSPILAGNILLETNTAKVYGRNASNTESYTGTQIGVYCNLSAFTSKMTAVYDGTTSQFTCANDGFTLTANGSNLDIDMNTPTVSTSSDINKTYNASSSSISVTPNHGAAVDYSYQWYTSSGTAIQGATTNTLARTNVADSGTYYCVITAKLNSFEKTVQSETISVAIQKADIEGIEFTDSKVVYDGNIHTLEITGALPEKVSVSYFYNDSVFTGIKKQGSYLVNAVFTNENPNYNALANMNAVLTISPKEITVSFTGYEGLIYTGSKQGITIALNGIIDGEVCEYTVIGNEGTNAGTYTCEVSSITNSNYTLSGQTSLSWSIAKYQVEKPQEDSTVYTYTGESQTYQLSSSEYYTITNNTQTEAGTYTVIVTLKDKNNYEWQDGSDTDLEYTFKIEKREVEIFWSDTTFTYNGEEQEQGGIIAYYLSLPNSQKNYLTVICNSDSFKQAGGYSFRVELDDTKNYTIANSTDSHSYTIEKASITLQAEDKEGSYQEAIQGLTYQVVSGTNYHDEIIPTLITTATSTSSVGTYPITIAAENDNYNITLVDGTYKIQPKAINVNILDQASAYTGEEPTVDQNAYTTTEAENLGITIVKEQGVSAGEYKLTAEYTNTNYDITFIYTKGQYSVYTIEEADFTVQTTNYQGSYDGQAHSGEIEVGLEEGQYTIYYSMEEINEMNYQSATTVNPTFRNAGKATIYYYIMAKDYQDSFGSFTVEIAPKEITVSFTGYDGLIYTGRSQSITISLNGILEGEVCEYTAIGNEGTNAGTYTCEVSSITNDNYTLSGQTSLVWSIAKATYHDITHRDITIQYQEGISLSDIELENGYTFKTTEGVLHIGDNLIPAVYNLDKTNYEDYELTILVKVNFIPTEELPKDENNNIIVDDTNYEDLKDILDDYNQLPQEEKDNLDTEVKEELDKIQDSINQYEEDNQILKTPVITSNPVAGDILLGQTLEKSSLTGGTANVEGRFTWVNPSQILALGTHRCEAVFTPNDTKYQAVTIFVSVEVKELPKNEDNSIIVDDTNYEDLKDILDDYNQLPQEEKDNLDTGVKEELDKIQDSINQYEEENQLPITPIILTQPTASDIIYGEKLSSSSLIGGEANVEGEFVWNDLELEPTVGIHSYEVMFIPSDRNSYNPVRITVKVSVGKAEVEIITNPTASDIVYGEKLSSSSLTGGEANVEGIFVWKDLELEPTAGIHSYEVMFIPSDTNTYNSKIITIEVNVGKAVPKMNELPTASKVLAGQALHKSVLTGGLADIEGTFTWVNPTLILKTGTQACEVIFTPKNENYQTTVLWVNVEAEALPKDEKDNVIVDDTNYEELKEIADSYQELTEEEREALDEEVREELEKIEQAIKEYETKDNNLAKVLWLSIGIPCSVIVLLGILGYIVVRKRRKA